jgi:hypothetical protein
MSAANLIREIGRPDEGHQWDFVGMADGLTAGNEPYVFESLEAADGPITSAGGPR